MPEDTVPAMDYASHERTYESFINFSKIGVIGVLTIVLCLILFGFGGTVAHVFGWLMLIANVLAIAVGAGLGQKGWVPAAGVFVLTGILTILTV